MTGEPPPPASPERLVDDGVALLKDYLADPRTSVLRRLAEVIVDLRSRFTLNDGRTDWSGRSRAYRAAIGDLYLRSGVSKKDLDNLQAALRYHVGNLLRERASKEELLAVGMTSTSPKDRNAATREAIAALSQSAGGRPPRTDIDRLSVYAQALLTIIDETAIEELEDERAEVSRRALESVSVRAEELLAVLERRGRGKRTRRSRARLAPV